MWTTQEFARGDTEETTNSPSQDGSHTEKIRNIKVYSVTDTSAGGAFNQLLYFSPGFTSLLLYIKKPITPFRIFLYGIIYYNPHVWYKYTSY